MSKKEFNKNEFKKSQDKMSLIFLILFITGIIYVICGLFVGDYSILAGNFVISDDDPLVLDGNYGGGVSKGEDPADYYGVYYGAEDYVYITFEFDEYECLYTVTNGLSEQRKYYKYEYVSAEYAQTRYPNEKFEGCDAIVVYEDQYQEKVIVLWVEKVSSSMSSPLYEFTVGATGQSITSIEYDIAEDMGDPENYYGDFIYNSNNYVSFEWDGTAKVCINGKVKEYSYMFVNNGWMKKHLKGSYSCEYALAVYTEDSSNIMIFEYYKDYIKYSGEKFYKN